MTTETSLVLPESDIFAPSLFETLFWRPRFSTDTPLLVHTPFLFWLAGVARPHRVAILGAGDGYAHFLFCQAIDKLNLRARCDGFGFWQDGETGATLCDSPPALTDHADQLYNDISRLTACADTGAATAMVKDHSLDLMLVDLDELGDDAQPRFDDLRALLSDTGILVIHDTRNLRKQASNGMSLHKQLMQLDHIEFEDGHGLGVFAIGEDQPPRLRNLMATCTQGALPVETETVFRRLGTSIAAIEKARFAQKAAAETKKALTKAQTAQQKDAEELSELRTSVDLKGRKLADVQSALFDIRTQLQEQTARAETARAALAEAQSERDTASRIRFEETASLTKVSETLRNELEAVRDAQDKQNTDHVKKLAQRDARIAELAAQLEEAQKDRPKAQAEVNRQTKELVQLTKRLEKSEKETRRWKREVDKLRASTSWRVTAPLRTVKNSVLRKK